jgi:hypothetical protein
VPWLAALSGCIFGGQTGGEKSAPQCQREIHAVPRSERTMLGFSANDVLAYAGGTHEVGALWPIDPDDADRAHGATMMLTLTPRSPKVHFVAAQGGTENVCRAHLVIDVRVEIELRHADASARLYADAVLDASARDFAFLPSKYVKPENIVGDAMVALPPDTELLDYAIDAMFSPGGTSGHVMVRLRASGAPEDAGTNTPDSQKLASWPAASE